MHRLDRETDLKREQIKLAGFLTYSGFSLAVIVISILVYMSFFGNLEQGKTASDLLSTLLKGFAGIGSYLIVKSVFNKLTRPPSD